ncbi:aig2 family [Fusarium austroafricanum]|uniref:gamma-glutamylcyclotransferase n=1 Tax=Fusarium austroafricanum TaxID=2364996 RepID=A0A8H4NHN6_9HYPO|nr:aig2 family [Fusarium austroafricanum]
MNVPADETHADTGQPITKYYFAYGSNLHLQQMKRRCPGSKFIGSGKLADHRWQINERGYANVIEAQGHWVEGLVYEINARDEARLDINEGVSKDAYQKQYMTVTLRRAEAALYRRPVSWIVNNGGPDHARLLAQGEGQRKAINHKPHLEQNILVYISPRYIVDSEPKEEYVNRINSGIVDARSLGVTNDYISNCVRPFIPAPTGQNSGTRETTGVTQSTTPPKPKVVRKVPSPAKKVKQPTREIKRTTPLRGRESSPNKTTGQRPIQNQPQVVQGQRLTRSAVSNVPERLRGSSQPRSHVASAPPLPPRPLAPHYTGNALQVPVAGRRRPASEVGAPQPPPLPPRPTRRVRSIPVIVTQQGYGGYWYR